MVLDRAPWVVVLAGGAGERLGSLTRGVDGVVVPKQFCSLRGGPSLLEQTLERAFAVTARDRVLAVVTAGHEVWFEEQLAPLPHENVLVQPQPRGTAPAVLLAVGEVQRRDPRGRLALMPSDHWFDAPEVALTALRKAFYGVDERHDRPVLLGISPDGPESQYGWIVSGDPAHGDTLPVRPVLRFVEKPPRDVAAALWRDGAVWNSLLCAAHAASLWQLCERHVPAVTAALAPCFVAAERCATTLAAAYRSMSTVDFSHALLQPGAAELGVVVVPACGWTDLGTPARVAECLHRQGATNGAGFRPPERRAPVVLAHALAVG